MSRSASPDDSGINRRRDGEHRYLIDCQDCEADWELVANHNICDSIARFHEDKHDHEVVFEIIERHREMIDGEPTR